MVVDRRRKNGLVGHGTPAARWSEPAEVFGADGAAALYRRETLEDCAIDGEVFDPDLERWASDADLAWRARVLGLDVRLRARRASSTTSARTAPRPARP